LILWCWGTLLHLEPVIRPQGNNWVDTMRCRQCRAKNLTLIKFKNAVEVAFDTVCVPPNARTEYRCATPLVVNNGQNLSSHGVLIDHSAPCICRYVIEELEQKSFWEASSGALLLDMGHGRIDAPYSDFPSPDLSCWYNCKRS
jgi:hypothetical protein